MSLAARSASWRLWVVPGADHHVPTLRSGELKAFLFEAPAHTERSAPHTGQRGLGAIADTHMGSDGEDLPIRRTL